MRAQRKVYFIRPVGMDSPVKIGVSASPTARRDTLDNWSPFALEIIAEIEVPEGIERRFHALFKHLHERREWFTWAPEIAEVVEAIHTQTFDVNSLPPPVYISNQVGLPRPHRHGTFYAGRLRGMMCMSGFAPATLEPRTAEERKAAEEYLAAPHIHGQPIKAKWAHATRVAWRASVAANMNGMSQKETFLSTNRQGDFVHGGANNRVRRVRP